MFMRNRLARKMAAEMRGATCAGTQTSKAPTLSGPSVTNHYSVVSLLLKTRYAETYTCLLCTEPKTPQTCCKLSILPACQQVATSLSTSSSCNKSVKIRLVATC